MRSNKLYHVLNADITQKRLGCFPPDLPTPGVIQSVNTVQHLTHQNHQNALFQDSLGKLYGSHKHKLLYLFKRLVGEKVVKLESFRPLRPTYSTSKPRTLFLEAWLHSFRIHGMYRISLRRSRAVLDLKF